MPVTAAACAYLFDAVCDKLAFSDHTSKGAASHSHGRLASVCLDLAGRAAGSGQAAQMLDCARTSFTTVQILSFEVLVASQQQAIAVAGMQASDRICLTAQH